MRENETGKKAERLPIAKPIGCSRWVAWEEDSCHTANFPAILLQATSTYTSHAAKTAQKNRRVFNEGLVEGATVEAGMSCYAPRKQPAWRDALFLQPLPLAMGVPI